MSAVPKSALGDAAAFIRFVTARVHKDSHRQEGVFAAAYALLDSGSLDQEELRRIREILIWFNKNLPTPAERFSADRAVLWFKASSKEISQVWELRASTARASCR